MHFYITAGAEALAPLGSLLVGLLCGILVVHFVEILDKKMKIDDPVGAVSVHGLCGALGTVLVGALSVQEGFLYGHGFQLFLIQVLGVAAVALWSLMTAGLLFYGLKTTVGIRVMADEEIKGLDYKEHGLEAYADFVPR